MTTAKADRRTTAERIASACVSGDLSPGRGTTLGVLMAVGMAGVRRGAKGAALIRFGFALDARAHDDARDAVRAMARHRAHAAKWMEPMGAGIERPVTTAQLIRLADAAFVFWVDSTCRRCKGRKEGLVKDEGGGRRALSGTACPSCHGSGKRAFQMRTRFWQARGLEVLAMINDEIARTERAVGRRLRNGS